MYLIILKHLKNYFPGKIILKHLKNYFPGNNFKFKKIILYFYFLKDINFLCE